MFGWQANKATTKQWLIIIMIVRKDTGASVCVWDERKMLVRERAKIKSKLKLAEVSRSSHSQRSIGQQTIFSSFLSTFSSSFCFVLSSESINIIFFSVWHVKKTMSKHLINVYSLASLTFASKSYQFSIIQKLIENWVGAAASAHVHSIRVTA